MQSLVPWAHLHQWVKQKTADLQRLPAEVTNNPPFSGLPALAGHVEERLHRDLLSAGQAEKKEWLATLGAERSEEHTSELQSLMRISYAVFCLKKKQYQTE